MIQSFTETVAGIRRAIEAHGAALSKNEMMTRYALIDPLLRELGWDLSDPEIAVPEDAGPGGKTDYTLGGNAMIVEAKRLDENLDRHADIVIKYVKTWNARYGVLTNGQKWKMYDANATTKSPEIEFDIIDPDGVVLSKALRLHRVVVSESVQSHKKDSATLDDYELSGDLTADMLDTAPANIGEIYNTIIYNNHTWTAGKYMVDLLMLVARWLVQEGLLTTKHCPIKTGPKNYLLHTEPRHPNGLEFHRSKRLGKRMYLNTALSSNDIIHRSLDLMEVAGLDRSKIRLSVRRR